LYQIEAHPGRAQGDLRQPRCRHRLPWLWISNTRCKPATTPTTSPTSTCATPEAQERPGQRPAIASRRVRNPADPPAVHDGRSRPRDRPHLIGGTVPSSHSAGRVRGTAGYREVRRSPVRSCANFTPLSTWSVYRSPVRSSISFPRRCGCSSGTRRDRRGYGRYVMNRTWGDQQDE
jgi:hypothetical protein